MIKSLSKKRTLILLILLIVAIIAGVSIYRSRSTKLLDKEAYSEVRTAIEAVGESEEGGFADQRALMDLIEQWADSRSIEYKEDKHGNIIFDKPAAGRKKNLSPTLIAVSMNYETAVDNARVLASAAAIAASDVEAGRTTIVFFNDEQALAKGYKGISQKLITSKTRAIYLDRGSSNYISTASFEQRASEVTIPAEREDNPCDTAVRITITGITSGVIGPGISKRPDPLSALSVLLLWLIVGAAANKRSPRMGTGALTTIKVFYVIGLVGLCIGLAFTVIFGLVAVLSENAGELSYEMASYFNSLLRQYGVAFALPQFSDQLFIYVFFGGLAIALIFGIIFTAKVLKTINTAKRVVNTGRPDDRVSPFLAVLIILGAVFSICGAVSQLLRGASVAELLFAVSGLISAAASICFAVVIFKFRSGMRRLGVYRGVMTHPMQ